MFKFAYQVEISFVDFSTNKCINLSNKIEWKIYCNILYKSIVNNERNFINNVLLRIWPKSLELFLNFYRLIYDSNLRKLLWNSINDLIIQLFFRIIFLPSIHFQLFITTTI